MSYPRLGAVLLAVALAVTGCNTAPDPKPSASPAVRHRTALPAENTVVVPGAGASELSIGMSRAVFTSAPAVVLVGEGDETSLGEGVDRAQRLGVPLLLLPAKDDLAAAVRAELDRLAPRTVLALGDAANRWATAAPAASPSPAKPALGVNDTVALSKVEPDTPLDQLLVLAVDQPAGRAAIATAKAAGARVTTLTQPDPRIDPKTIEALAKQPVDHVLGLGDAFGKAEQLRSRVDTAHTGVQLPGSGQVLFPYRRMVALYGHPGDTRLGALGEQSVDAAVTRAKKVAGEYSSLVKEPVLPTFELIATVASGSAGADGDYSSESSIAHLKPWVDAAGKNGMYVMLDLQPGLTDFLTQAKRYEELLKEPHVGLALDPEWRLKPGQKHMQQIGTVDAAEINATAAWLADLTRANHLPQKVLMLHQFRLDMITNRGTVDTTHDELQIVVHADGFGTRGQKLDTWRALHQGASSALWWGWKNFYDEDQPTFTPAETYKVSPSPVFVSYQ